MLNISYLKLLKLSFVVLLVMVFTIGFTKNTSYAITYEEFKDYLNQNKSEVINSDKLNAINYFINNNIELINQSWFDLNTIIIGVPTLSTSANGIDSWEFYFYDTDNDTKMYLRKPSSISYLNFGENVNYINISFWYRHREGTWEIHTQNTGTTGEITATPLLGKNNQYMVSNKNVYTSQVSDNIADYIFINPFQDGLKFTQNTNFTISYSDNDKLLGYFTNVNRKSDIEAILYQNGNIIAQYGVSTSPEDYTLYISDDYNLYIPNRLIYTGLTYDLLIYDRITTNSNYYYYTFGLLSGDTGYTSQNSTNDIIQNQNNNTQDIVNAIESGNNNINDFLTSPLNLSGESISSGDIIGALDMNFSGDPYQNVWITLIDGLRNCLVGVNRQFDIEINNTTYTISLDSFSPKLPASLKTFLSIVSTTFMLWVLIRWIKLSIDKVQTANIDNLLQQNEEERHN